MRPTPSSKPSPSGIGPTTSSEPIKSSFNSRQKVLFAGDSVAHTASFRNVESLTNTRIKTVCAYSSVYNDTARWPQYNFTEVVNYNLKNPGVDAFDVLVLAAPTVDITNLNTSQLSSTDNTEIFQQNVIVSAQNMLSLAKASLEQNKGLRRVVLLEHPPRFDKIDVDPASIKPNLVQTQPAVAKFPS